MEENEQSGETSKPDQAFYIEAAIDERGPQKLKIVPSYNQYLVFEDEDMITCIQLNDDNEWEQVDGSFTNGVVSIIGQEIMRAKRQIKSNHY